MFVVKYIKLKLIVIKLIDMAATLFYSRRSTYWMVGSSLERTFLYFYLRFGYFININVAYLKLNELLFIKWTNLISILQIVWIFQLEDLSGFKSTGYWVLKYTLEWTTLMVSVSSTIIFIVDRAKIILKIWRKKENNSKNMEN